MHSPVSLPESKRYAVRQIAAGTMMAAGAGCTLAVKLTRQSDIFLAPEWLAAVLPNFVCASMIPIAIFLSRRTIQFRDTLWMAAFSAMMLVAYEIAQLWMPRRTFDWNDIWATVAGATFSICLSSAIMLTSKLINGIQDNLARN